jgi:hypothetical protein
MSRPKTCVTRIGLLLAALAIDQAAAANCESLASRKLPKGRGVKQIPAKRRPAKSRWTAVMQFASRARH